MSARSAIDQAVMAAAHANRQNAGKWNQLYAAFDDHLNVDRGVAGKLLTQEKQLSNRLQKELPTENPSYVVLCALSSVRIEKAKRHLAEARLPAARCALLLAYDEENDRVEPVELQLYDPDSVTTQIAQAYPELTPITIVRPETRTMAGPGAATVASGGRAKPVTVVPMVVDDRIRRAIRLAVLTTSAVLLVGPPGTGKTALIRELLDEVQADPEGFGFTSEIGPPIWTTPEESWGTRELVGGETVAEDGSLRFREGHVLRAITEHRWLVLDEANRADMDKIFGGLLTWLSNQEVELGTSSNAPGAPAVTLGWADSPESRCENLEELSVDPDAEEHGGDPVRYLAGQEWRLLGTYNALDAQRVFRFGHALGRRFLRVPIPPISPTSFETAASPLLIKLPTTLRARIPALYGAHWAEEGTQLGPALFMRIPEYVEAGLLREDEFGDEVESDDNVGLYAEAGESGDDALPPDYGVKLLSEAYMINVGAFLARYEPDELDRLGARIVDSGALPESEWQWLLTMSQHLG